MLLELLASHVLDHQSGAYRIYSTDYLPITSPKQNYQSTRCNDGVVYRNLILLTLATLPARDVIDYYIPVNFGITVPAGIDRLFSNAFLNPSSERFNTRVWLQNHTCTYMLD
jgi:hypothetical protein